MRKYNDEDLEQEKFPPIFRPKQIIYKNDNPKKSEKEIKKVMNKKTKLEIETKLKFPILNLRLIFINGMKYHLVSEVMRVIEYAINESEEPQIINEFENIKTVVKKLTTVPVYDINYYCEFEVFKIIDFALYELEKKIRF